MTWRRGNRGTDVESIQKNLQILGFLDPNVRGIGIFGPKTQQAVVDFQQAYLVDGIVDVVTQSALERAVEARQRLDETIAQLPLQPPQSYEELLDIFGDLPYKEGEGGYIEIDEEWVADNLVKVVFPVVGKQICHKKLLDTNLSLFEQLQALGLDRLIEQASCYCPRHKMHDPSRRRSTHSWAISWDINWATNPVGFVGTQHPDVIRVFEKHGYSWGGRWRVRDDMHYQFATGY